MLYCICIESIRRTDSKRTIFYFTVDCQLNLLFVKADHETQEYSFRDKAPNIILLNKLSHLWPLESILTDLILLWIKTFASAQERLPK